ncbi:hypothetical protein SDC9_88659 [bioreactor metagenome]|uniref:Uncharacterized protein n=1 Tax=bioreactor metagenome TaxID=1076179 RepID=A0A644ZMP0_9ZZZZ
MLISTAVLYLSLPDILLDDTAVLGDIESALASIPNVVAIVVANIVVAITFAMTFFFLFNIFLTSTFFTIFTNYVKYSNYNLIVPYFFYYINNSSNGICNLLFCNF